MQNLKENINISVITESKWKLQGVKILKTILLFIVGLTDMPEPNREL
jgi:hypothetical protein